MTRRLVTTSLVWAAPVAWMLLAEPALAQRYFGGFTIGGGSSRVHIGIGGGSLYRPGYGYGYDYGYGYGPRYGYGYGPPVVVQPYPVYQPQPAYTVPQTHYVPESAFAGELAVPAVPTPIVDGGEILIFSPSTNAGEVHYALNGHPYTMPAGTKQKFTNDRTWTVEFEPAPGLPPTRYTLSSGRYKFKPSDAGMALYQTQDLPETQPQAVPPAPIPSLPRKNKEVLE